MDIKFTKEQVKFLINQFWGKDYYKLTLNNIRYEFYKEYTFSDAKTGKTGGVKNGLYTDEDGINFKTTDPDYWNLWIDENWEKHNLGGKDEN